MKEPGLSWGRALPLNQPRRICEERKREQTKRQRFLRIPANRRRGAAAPERHAS
jgi:hypothetical protein